MAERFREIADVMTALGIGGLALSAVLWMAVKKDFHGGQPGTGRRTAGRGTRRRRSV